MIFLHQRKIHAACIHIICFTLMSYLGIQISKQLAYLVMQTYGRQTHITLELNIMGSCSQVFIEALTPESFLD